MANSLVVIPARMHSTRLPRKMLLSETGKPLIQHTYEAARRSKLPREMVVATDHDEIRSTVEAFGGKAVMTDPDAPSGTDRVAEAAQQFPGFDIVVNVQGDEPEISGDAIDRAIELLLNDDDAVMATLATPITDSRRIDDPACVKVVFDRLHNALYFSRAPIPFARDGWNQSHLSSQLEQPVYFQHLGLYAYRRDFLVRLSSLPPGSWEQIEKLEQLRVLQAGFRIKIGVIQEPSIGIDTPADYEAFVKRARC